MVPHKKSINYKKSKYIHIYDDFRGSGPVAYSIRA